jgi:F-type H+-transporting ATPase subunit b
MRLLSLIAAEDPTQTHHWLLPETAEIIYGGLAFLIVATGLWKFALPEMKKALAARSAKIGDQLQNAADTRAAAEAEASSIRQAIGDIAGERSRLLAEAESQAAAILTEGRDRIAAEVADLEAKAEADIAASRSRSSDELRAEIAQLATVAANSAVTASLTPGIHQDLIEGFINGVGATR